MITKAKKIAVLKQVRERIADNHRQHVFICLYLMEIKTPTALRLIEYIREALGDRRDGGGRHTLYTWQDEHHPGLPAGDDRRVQSRLQWIDWMIEQLEQPRRKP